MVDDEKWVEGGTSTEKGFNDLSSTFMVKGYKVKPNAKEMDEYLYHKINPSGI